MDFDAPQNASKQSKGLIREGHSENTCADFGSTIGLSSREWIRPLGNRQDVENLPYKRLGVDVFGLRFVAANDAVREHVHCD
jgi:hypothetical protein